MTQGLIVEVHECRRWRKRRGTLVRLERGRSRCDRRRNLRTAHLRSRPRPDPMLVASILRGVGRPNRDEIKREQYGCAENKPLLRKSAADMFFPISILQVCLDPLRGVRGPCHLIPVSLNKAAGLPPGESES